jgi:hypothetical protein
MPNHNLSKSVYLEKQPFDISVDHYVASTPYRIHIYVYKMIGKLCL